MALTITEHGDRCRYFVTSESNPRARYFVDLLEHEGRGSCSCKDWSCRCWPIVKAGGQAMCKHLRACREHFLNQILAAMAAKETQPLSL